MHAVNLAQCLLKNKRKVLIVKEIDSEHPLTEFQQKKIAIDN